MDYTKVTIEEDEIQLLESYFCKKDELTVQRTHNNCTIKLQVESMCGDNTTATATTNITEVQVRLRRIEDDKFQLSSDPSFISITQTSGPHVNKKLLDSFKHHLVQHLTDMITEEGDQFSLFTFLVWISDALREAAANQWFTSLEHDTSHQDTQEDIHGMLLTLDHIRSTTRYYKFFKDAALQCHLNVRLVRYGKQIVEVVFGEPGKLKEYVKLHRSSLVDVDSQGRPCKERMMQVKVAGRSVSSDVVQRCGLRVAGFTLVEVSSREEFRRVLDELSFSVDYVTYM